MRPVIQLATQVGSKRGCKIYELVREMAKRKVSNQVDKLSGISVNCM